MTLIRLLSMGAIWLALVDFNWLSAQVRHPHGKPLSLELQQDKKTDKHLVVWVASEGFVPANLPGPKGVPAIAKKYRFMESASISTDQFQVGPITYRVLVKPKSDGSGVESHLGWIDENLLVMSNEPEQDALTKVFRKVMIVNSEADLVKAENFSHLVPIRLSAHPDAPTAQPCRLFQLFFKWGEALGSDGERYLLIGSSTSISVTKSPEELSKLVLGWVPEARICRWDTREALYWDRESTLPKEPQSKAPRRTARGYVFRTPEQAQSALPAIVKGAADFAPEEKQYLAREGWDENNVSVAAPAHEMRFPILEMLPSEREAISKQIGENPKWELLRVGVVGDFVDENGKVVASASAISELQLIARTLQAQMERIEILFVIDDTSSMGAWFPRAAATVEKIAGFAQSQQEKVNVRVGVAYYNDTDNQPAGHDPVKVMPLVDPSTAAGKKLIEELRKHKVCDGGDGPEMLFTGIERGVREAGFSPDARKLVIVLGDAGDHAGKDAAQLQKVAAALTPAGQTAFDFSAILVMSDRDANVRETAQSFKEQMQKLKELLNPPGEGGARAVYASIDDARQVEDAIIAGYQTLLKRADAVADELRKLGRGQWGKTQISNDVRNALKRRRAAADVDKLLSAKGGVQLFERGYAWVRKEHKDDIRSPDAFCELLLLDAADVSHVSKLLKNLQPPPVQAGSAAADYEATDPLEIVKEAIVAAAGEDLPKGASWNNVILKSRGLTALSPLLNRQIKSAKPGTFDLQEIFDLEYKQWLLDDLASGKQHQYKSTPKEIAGGVIYQKYERQGLIQNPPQRYFHFGELKTVNWFWVDKYNEWP